VLITHTQVLITHTQVLITHTQDPTTAPHLSQLNLIPNIIKFSLTKPLKIVSLLCLRITSSLYQTDLPTFRGHLSFLCMLRVLQLILLCLTTQILSGERYNFVHNTQWTKCTMSLFGRLYYVILYHREILHILLHTKSPPAESTK